MRFPDILILGYGKMPADCTKVLLDHSRQPTGIWETEKTPFSFLKGFCSRCNVDYKLLGKQETTSLLEAIKKHTVIFSINNNYIFPTDIIKKKHLRIVNFHNALLPVYPGHGRRIPTWVIFNGESRHGVTWHLVSQGIDAGNILCQSDFPVAVYDTALSIMMRSMKLGVNLFRKYWKDFMDYQFLGRAQETLGGKVYHQRDLPHNGYFNFAWDFFTAWRFFRAMDSGPFQDIIPKAKVIIGNKPYRLRSYKVKQEKNCIQDRCRWYLEQDTLNILYPDGKIQLIIRKILDNEYNTGNFGKSSPGV